MLPCLWEVHFRSNGRKAMMVGFTFNRLLIVLVCFPCALMVQKSYSEGMRALVLYTASIQDEIELAEAAGDKDRTADMIALNDLLLPIVKGYGSEKSWTLLGTESLQTFGGSGFTQDWPLEQYDRDAKIDTVVSNLLRKSKDRAATK